MLYKNEWHAVTRSLRLLSSGFGDVYEIGLLRKTGFLLNNLEKKNKCIMESKAFFFIFDYNCFCICIRKFQGKAPYLKNQISVKY